MKLHDITGGPHGLFWASSEPCGHGCIHASASFHHPCAARHFGIDLVLPGGGYAIHFCECDRCWSDGQKHYFDDPEGTCICPYCDNNECPVPPR